MQQQGNCFGIPDHRILEEKSRFLSLDSLPPSVAERGVPLFYQEQPVPNLEAVEELVRWALKQTEMIQEVIWAFLDDPDGMLETTLEKLGLEEKEATRDERKPISSTQLVRDSLPATYDELLILVQANTFNKRPAATVRQILRRLTRTGEIELVEGVYQNA